MSGKHLVRRGYNQLPHFAMHSLGLSRRSAVTNSFADGDLLITEEPRLPVFEGGLNLPSLVWPPSRLRDPALFAPARFDRP